MARRAVLAGIAVGGVVAGIFSLHVVRTAPEYSYSGDSVAGAVALLGTGWALIACGVAFSTRDRRARWGLLVASSGVAWFLLQWNNPLIGSPLAFTAGLCLYAACPPLVAHAVLAYPRGRIASNAERAALALGYGANVIVLGLLPAILFDPAQEACAQCPGNEVVISDHPGAVSELHRFGLYIGFGWACAVAALIVVRLVRGTPVARRATGPVALAGGAYLGLVAATFAGSFDRGFLWNGTIERRLWLGEAGTLTALTVAAGLAARRDRRTRGTVARLLLDLERSPPAGGLRDALAGIVGDPELVLGYPRGASDDMVDASGRPVDLDRSEQRTTLAADGKIAAVLGHAPGLLDDPQLVEGVTAAARLALENERLQAEVRAQLEDLRSSRVRIVEAADSERTRLERDLHDGAQQRLVAMALTVRLLRSRLETAAGSDLARRLELVEAELDGAIADLRELAHGIFPAVLTDGGLAVAVRALAEEGRVPITIEWLSEDRFPAAVETAAYAVVAEAAQSATGALTVRCECTDARLVIDVGLRGDPELNVTGLDDRIGTLGGTLEIERPRGGVIRIHAELPCAS